jgi:hypothetical protein
MSSNTDTRKRERNAYGRLKLYMPGTRYTRFAGQIVRTRRYMDRSSDIQTRRVMNKVYAELVSVPEYSTLLTIGA